MAEKLSKERECFAGSINAPFEPAKFKSMYRLRLGGHTLKWVVCMKILFWAKVESGEAAGATLVGLDWSGFTDRKHLLENNLCWNGSLSRWLATNSNEAGAPSVFDGKLSPLGN
jgi:hypothetical protein